MEGTSTLHSFPHPREGNDLNTASRPEEVGPGNVEVESESGLIYLGALRIFKSRAIS